MMTYFELLLMFGCLTVTSVAHAQEFNTTVVILHGFGENSNVTWVRALERFALKNGDFAQVIPYNWIHDSDYEVAAANIKSIGDEVGEDLTTKIIPNSYIIFTAYDMGAHVAGVAAQKIQEITNTTVLGIIGLDPSEYLFQDEDISKRLSVDDAGLVLVYHTTRGQGKYGYDGSLGDFDFYFLPSYTDVPCTEEPTYEIRGSDATARDFCIHRSVLPLHARVLRNEFWICQISGEACINPIPHWDLSIPRGQYNLFLTAIQFHVYRNTVKTTGETFGRPAPIHGKNTYVLIHGFKETSLTPWYQKMISYGGTVISIDWSAEFTEDYETTAAKIRIIGNMVGQYLKNLEFVESYHNFKFVAYDMGAHIAGVAARVQKGETQIFAFDPSRPLLEDDDINLSKDDAKNIFVARSCDGKFGWEKVRTFSNVTYVQSEAECDLSELAGISNQEKYVIPSVQATDKDFCDHVYTLSYMDSFFESSD